MKEIVDGPLSSPPPPPNAREELPVSLETRSAGAPRPRDTNLWDPRCLGALSSENPNTQFGTSRMGPRARATRCLPKRTARV